MPKPPQGRSMRFRCAGGWGWPEMRWSGCGPLRAVSLLAPETTTVTLLNAHDFLKRITQLACDSAGCEGRMNDADASVGRFDG